MYMYVCMYIYIHIYIYMSLLVGLCFSLSASPGFLRSSARFYKGSWGFRVTPLDKDPKAKR